MATSSSDQLTVIFNAASSFDSVIRCRFASWDRHNRIAWVPCQSTDPPEFGERLCERVIVAITSEGDVDTGWRAIARSVAIITGSKWEYRIATLPVICPLMTMLTAFVARVLRRIPGIQPWSNEHPDSQSSSTSGR